MDFPLISTKIEGITETFDLDSPAGRYEYFQAKVGAEIEFIKTYLDEGNSFLTFWLAKKGAGKGTYSKMLAEVIGEERLAHISVGDIVRHVHESMADPQLKVELLEYLHQRYRGPLTVEQAIDALLGRSTKVLLPTEFILALVKREVAKLSRQGILIDGFPRGLDQVSYSLYFREIMNLEDDPDFFILVDVSDSVLNARIKRRVVCPLCQLSRNTATLITKDIEYDETTQSFYLICENPACAGFGTQRMGEKEGDALGIDGVRERLEADQALIEYASNLQGVDKIYIQNSYPVGKALDYLDEYEIAHEHVFSYNNETAEVEVKKQPWVIADNAGNEVYSVTAPAALVMFIRQLYDNLH